MFWKKRKPSLTYGLELLYPLLYKLDIKSIRKYDCPGSKRFTIQFNWKKRQVNLAELELNLRQKLIPYGYIGNQATPHSIEFYFIGVPPEEALNKLSRTWDEL